MLRHSLFQGTTLVLAAGLLSACAPNPSVLQDNVYGRYPQSVPQVPMPSASNLASTSSVYNYTPKNTSTASVYNYAPKNTATTVLKPAQPVTPVTTIPLPTPKPTAVETLTLPSKPVASTETVVAQPMTPTPTETSLNRTPKKFNASPATVLLLKQANAEAASGKLADASSTIERALRIEPNNPDLWQKLSELNKLQGNTQQAASMAAKAQYYQELTN